MDPGLYVFGPYAVYAFDHDLTDEGIVDGALEASFNGRCV